MTSCLSTATSFSTLWMLLRLTSLVHSMSVMTSASSAALWWRAASVPSEQTGALTRSFISRVVHDLLTCLSSTHCSASASSPWVHLLSLSTAGIERPGAIAPLSSCSFLHGPNRFLPLAGTLALVTGVLTPEVWPQVRPDQRACLPLRRRRR